MQCGVKCVCFRKGHVTGCNPPALLDSPFTCFPNQKSERGQEVFIVLEFILPSKNVKILKYQFLVCVIRSQMCKNEYYIVQSSNGATQRDASQMNMGYGGLRDGSVHKGIALIGMHTPMGETSQYVRGLPLYTCTHPQVHVHALHICTHKMITSILRIPKLFLFGSITPIMD